jgi:ferredoxin
MAEHLHVVDPEACSGDGICVEICPENALELVDEKAVTVDERAKTCISCGQCVASCPTEALEMPSLEMEDFSRLAPRPFGYDEFFEFLRMRRSVRVFKDRPVEREVIDKILEAAATAPMGMPPHTTEVVVIDQREELDYLLGQLVDHYDSTVKAFSSPIGRVIVRLNAGAESYGVLKHHIIDTARFANELYRRDGTDRYMYRAPVLMMFHASRWGMSYEESAHLVCHHAMLSAVALGLGTTIIGMIPPVVDRSKELRERYGIPKDHRVLTSLILGYPKYKYRRGIRRDLAGVQFNSMVH